MSIVHDTSGIDSLRGFSFQIKVFIWQLLNITDNNTIEYEGIEDVNVTEFSNKKLDKREDLLLTYIKEKEQGLNNAIQVKHTKLTKESIQQLLLNWLYIELDINNITEYTLVTATEYENKEEDISTFNIDQLYQNIITTEKSKRSLIRKVKDRLNNDRSLFNSKITSIMRKFKFIEVNIDDEINKSGSKLFVRKYENDVIFSKRLKRFSIEIIGGILDSVDKRNTFTIGFSDMRLIVDKVNNEITEEKYTPYITSVEKRDYQDRLNEIEQMREYIQLSYCNLTSEKILRYINYRDNYITARLNYLSLHQVQKINMIEEISYDNFEDVKEELLEDGNDSPNRRLRKTKEKSNGYTDQEPIKYGSLIYLTRENEEERQISWKDD